jgi:hypothetical protein
MRDRLGLACTGLVLLGAGGAVTATGLGAFGARHSARPVLAPAASRWIAEHHWFWPVAAGVGCLVAVLGIGWLAAQVRRRALRRIAMGAERTGATRMAARVAVRAVTLDVTSYPGVWRARVRLVGTERRPRVRIRVTCEDRTDLAELGRRIREDALIRLRLTLDRRDIAGVVDFRVVAENPAGG